jgi:hypothetical protein
VELAQAVASDNMTPRFNAANETIDIEGAFEVAEDNHIVDANKVVDEKPE